MLVSSAIYREILYILLFPYTKSPRSSLLAPLCIGNSSISSYFPIPGFPKNKCGCAAEVSYYVCLITAFHQRSSLSRMAKPPEAYVLDRLLSLMNIISQANIYLILCACTQPRILPKTIGNKVHSVSVANTRLTPKA